MTDVSLDYRFGWRWLLPVEEGSAVQLHGFSNEEEQFWREALPALECTVVDGHAEVLLLDGDHCVENADLSAAELEAARVVCVIVGRTRASRWRKRLKAGFPHCREYGLLPTVGPRVAVPLGSPEHAVKALGLHRPGRRMARLGLTLAGALAGLGHMALLRGRVLLIASKEAGSIPRGAVQADFSVPRGGQGVDYALYLGTPDGNRKTVVLPVGASAPNVILKVATSRSARASLSNEATALAALAASSLAAQVPKLVSMTDAERSLTLHQEYRPRMPAGQRRIREAVITFLGGLSGLNAGQRSLGDALTALPGDVRMGQSGEIAEACRRLHARLRRLAETGAMVAVHRSHGDFSPWNCAWTEQGLFVFDWEESREQDLAFGDAFYYIVAPALLVQRNADAHETLEEILRFAGAVAEAGAISPGDVRVYLALWLLRRVGQADFYDELLVLLERNWS
jgi:hypothetical protein